MKQRVRGQQFRLRAALLAAVVWVTACVSLPAPPSAQAVRLLHVPAFAQDDLQCGPAALASVLSASGLATTPDSLTPDLFIPDRRGSLQVELIAQTRRRGRLPVVLDAGSEARLIEALRGGHPVLVLLNLGLKTWPVWHYAAVTGFDPEQGYTLNDGAATAHTVHRRRFLRQWQLAEGWAITVHAADSPPAHTRPAPWIAAAAPLERSAPALAGIAYEAAVHRWPDSALAWAALGAARYAAGDLPAAHAALASAARLQPDDAAIANNLASTLLAQGCADQARAVLDGIDTARLPDRLIDVIAGTRRDIDAADVDRCPPAAPPPVEALKR